MIRARLWCGPMVIISLLLSACHSLPSRHGIPIDRDDLERDKTSVKLNAAEFVAGAEQQLAEMSVQGNVLAWAYETNITPETEKASADYGAKMSAVASSYAQQAAKYNAKDLDNILKRKLLKLRLTSTLASPSDPASNQELSNLATELNGMYGSGKAPYKGQLKDLGQLSEIVGDMSQSPQNRYLAWNAWHEISKPMKAKYVRLAQLANEGARELNFSDTGELWRSKYDMPADEFSTEVDRLWQQVKPLYDNLHCYVRGRLNEKYGDEVVSPSNSLAPHLLGNMWAQSWGGVYDLVAPQATNFSPSIDVTARLVANGYDHKKMFERAEGFYTSLGLRSLPSSFWQNSMFVKPESREVVCHASAWDVDNKDDVRVKMCTEITGEDFVTIHHELGHNYYQMAYQNQPFLFQDSANDGFHEAIGDTIALSMTPKYMQQIGLVSGETTSNDLDIPFLLRRALDKVAFLPFALVVDQWRWKVFGGEVTPSQYNGAWWQLRQKYQGIAPQMTRGEDYFDPGAKYHVPGNVPYTRYFLAAILQFQFYRSMCESAGHSGPLYQCSFFNNKIAGDRLNKMLEMGASRPWQEALKVMTGSTKMDATAILSYFEPLQQWLAQEIKTNKYSCGWSSTEQ